MLVLEDFIKFNETEKDFYELYQKYPDIHDNPPRTLEQLRKNEERHPEYRTAFERHFFKCPNTGNYLTENIFKPTEDVAVRQHYRYVPGFIHYHEFFEITYVMNGKYRNFVNGKLMELKKGDIFILSPNTYHCPATHLSEDIVFNILVKSSTFERLFFHILNNNPTLSAFFSRSLTVQSGGSYLQFSTKDDKEVEYLLLAMLNEYTHQEAYYVSMLNELMSALFILLLRNYADTLNTSFTDQLNFSHKIISIMGYIKNHLQDVTLPELAKEFSYSERQLSRLLNKYTGKNFMTILQETRIQKACILFQETDIPINEVIYQCGYKNQNHFYSMFKKYCGKTPAQYRKDFFNNRIS